MGEWWKWEEANDKNFKKGWLRRGRNGRELISQLCVHTSVSDFLRSVRQITESLCVSPERWLLSGLSNQTGTKDQVSKGKAELTFLDARNSIPRATWKL